MKRLTQKILYDGEEYYGSVGVPCNNLDYLGSVYNKLGQLEDIEEGIGVDLQTFLKVLKNKKIYVSDSYCTESGEDYGVYDYIEIEDVEYTEMSQEELMKAEYFKDYANCWVFIFRCYESYCDSYTCLVKLKDYGKTWALTKEELE